MYHSFSTRSHFFLSFRECTSVANVRERKLLVLKATRAILFSIRLAFLRKVPALKYRKKSIEQCIFYTYVANSISGLLTFVQSNLDEKREMFVKIQVKFKLKTAAHLTHQFFKACQYLSRN